MPTSILVIGRHAEIMETVLRLLRSQPAWSAEGALTDAEANARFQTQAFDLVLIGGGVEPASEARFREEFTRLRPAVKIIRHFGGGSGLLFNEIQQALEA
jgi:hypothetical protein